MPLKITKSSDHIEVSQLTVVLYSQPSGGKTSAGFTAESPILFDFDHGAYRSAFRKDTVQVASWDDVEGVTAEDLAPYKTVVVGTAGRALDALTAHIIAKNPKMKGFGGALNLQGYGALKSAFVSWLKQLHSFGKDVVLLAHSDESRNGDEIIERLDVQGGSKAEVYKSADCMGRLYFKDGKRWLNFSPTDVAFGKNPAQLPAMAVPDYTAEPKFLAGVIQSIKDKLNELSADAIAEQERIEKFRAQFAEIETAEDFNTAIKKHADSEPKIKGLLVAAGESKGLKFDRKAKAFVVQEAA